jgi:hypothetical protein
MRHAEAKQLLDRLCLEASGKPASTNKRSAKNPNRQGNDPEWWLENLGTCPPHDSPRSIAYLRAYVMIGEQSFYGAGIPLADGFLYPDRGVMKAMLRAECVVLNQEEHGRFELTDRGRALLATPLARGGDRQA